jgi:hypothetical protein
VSAVRQLTIASGVALLGGYAGVAVLGPFIIGQ